MMVFGDYIGTGEIKCLFGARGKSIRSRGGNRQNHRTFILSFGIVPEYCCQSEILNGCTRNIFDLDFSFGCETTSNQPVAGRDNAHRRRSRIPYRFSRFGAWFVLPLFFQKSFQLFSDPFGMTFHRKSFLGFTFLLQTSAPLVKCGNQLTQKCRRGLERASFFQSAHGACIVVQLKIETGQ